MRRRRSKRRPTSRRWRRELRRDGARLGQQLLEFAAAVHLQSDIAAPDQLAVNIELRIGGPVRVALECFAHLRLLENVDVLEVGADGAQGRNGLRRKSALWEIGRALHEQDDRARAELRLDLLD